MINDWEWLAILLEELYHDPPHQQPTLCNCKPTGLKHKMVLIWRSKTRLEFPNQKIWKLRRQKTNTFSNTCVLKCPHSVLSTKEKKRFVIFIFVLQKIHKSAFLKIQNFMSKTAICSCCWKNKENIPNHCSTTPSQLNQYQSFHSGSASESFSPTFTNDSDSSCSWEANAQQRLHRLHRHSSSSRMEHL